MGVYFGLDMGVASAGWAVVDDEYNVLESGSNLFKCADASENQKRRGMRQARRLVRRRVTRIHDFNRLWKKEIGRIPIEKCNTQLELRVKGITEKLELQEIYFVLYTMLKHRGISYLEDAVDETSSSSDFEKGLLNNKKELESRYPCEIQLERLDSYGKYRGEIVTKVSEDESFILSNVFTIGSYRKELEQFFKTQQLYHDCLTVDFIEKYMSIFNRKREYYVGPGNEKSRTDYGRFTTKIDATTGEFITEDNIFEKLIGKCSVYPEEMRAAGATYTAQEFNLLNDLNNLTVNNRKLTKKEKVEIVKEIQKVKAVNMRKIIEKVIEEPIATLTGVRIDKDEKEIFHHFEQYNKIRRALKDKLDVDITEYSRDTLDKLGNILTLNTEKESIIKAVKRENIELSADKGKAQEILDCLINLRKKNSADFNKWQSLSLKIMNELIPELYETEKNQMQILTEMGVFKTKKEKFSGYNKIPKEVILEDIYNPVVRRSIGITVEIVNALLKKYGYPDKIVIEMPRDKNSDEEKKRITDTQTKNEKELQGILDQIKKEYGITITSEDFKQHKKLTLKLKLWKEQNGICPYLGKPIVIKDLLDDPSMFEIDHIIPRSISFDDSRANKVLVYKSENQAKGNQTPYMYLNTVNRAWRYEQYKAYVLGLKKSKNITKQKLDNLLFEKDITKQEILQGFISRNINDTRYASKVILNSFQEFFASKNSGTKVKVIRGSFTSQMRNNLKLPKDRDESFSHHAVDAMLICFSQLGYDAYHSLQEQFIDFETGEILDITKWSANMDDKTYEKFIYGSKWLKITNAIKNAETKVKYWHRVDKKVNRGLCNQTIRGTRKINNKTMKINKINILEDGGFKIFKKKIEQGKEADFLMYRNDPKTFEQIMLIYNQYIDQKNPFVAYEQETGDYIRKYSKKHNGPRVKILKYLGDEVGSCIDISHKYGFMAGSQKVILESLNPYRSDVYYNEEAGTYRIIGLKYNDFKFSNGKYMIDEEAYIEVLIKEKLIVAGEKLKDLILKGYHYIFSLYENDIIYYEKDGKYYEERFLSRTNPKQKNYIETKPIHKSEFEKGRHKVGLGKTKCIQKIVTDILGNKYHVEQEKFDLNIDKE